MLFLRLLCWSTLTASVLGLVDIASLVTQTPQCVQNCALPVLTTGQCSNQNLVMCLCTNSTVQYNMAACVLRSCSTLEQFESSAVVQESLCKDFKTPTRWPEVARTLIILSVLTYPIIILRFVSRWVIARRFWWDDWCILAAVAFLIPMTVLPFIDANQGIGLHFWHLKPQHVVELRKIVYVIQILYIWIIGLSKASLLFLYLRIFTHKPFQRVVICFLIFTTTQCGMFMLLVIFQCIPMSGIWSLTPGKCLDLKILGFAGAALTIFEDFAILVLPIRELYKLNLSQRKKLALCFMFAFGSFASVTSIVRLVYVTKYQDSIDITWDNVDVIIWSNVEVFTCVICASIVAVRPLITTILPSSIFPTTVKETLPSPQSTSRKPQRWSMAFNKKQKRSSGHWRLKDEGGTGRVETEKSEKSAKVWVTNSTSVESSDIQMEDLNKEEYPLTPGYQGETKIESKPPIDPPSPR